MKLFVGRKSQLWVVEPKNGKVKRLPFTLPSLVFLTFLLIGIGSFSLDLLSRTGFTPKVWYDVLSKMQSADELDQKAKELNALVHRLQQEKEQASRLNQRLASKLENLEGALGSVAQEILQDSPNKSNNKLYKPASLQYENIPLGKMGMNQRLSIKKVDRLINQLRDLPHHSPVLYPQVNSHFGHRHSPNGIGTRYHRGVDFSLKRSDKVLAAGFGKVINAGYMRGYGLYLDIKHGNDIVTRYAHLSDIKVKEGQKVLAGQHIATGGSSGAATGKHLHFEVIVKGRSRDPMLFLSLPQKIQFALKNSENIAKIG